MNHLGIYSLLFSYNRYLYSALINDTLFKWNIFLSNLGHLMNGDERYVGVGNKVLVIIQQTVLVNTYSSYLQSRGIKTSLLHARIINYMYTLVCSESVVISSTKMSHCRNLYFASCILCSLVEN